MASRLIGRQAVVVGAGMAGLPAARVLADYFEHVTVLERDSLPQDTCYRSGTPQSKHVHGLLGGGQRALGNLFPAFEEDLVTAGAVQLRVGLDLRTEMLGYDPFPQRDLGWVSYSMSRPLIELVVRQRVVQYANIALYPHCRAQRIEATPRGMAVAAVRFERRDGKNERLPADLVIDASGRGALALGLLESIGQPQPPKTIIEVGTVGVVVSYIGERGTDLSGTEYRHGELVDAGFRGVWSKPLLPGKYAFNTYAGKVISVPTTNFVLKWTKGTSGPH